MRLMTGAARMAAMVTLSILVSVPTVGATPPPAAASSTPAGWLGVALAPAERSEDAGPAARPGASVRGVVEGSPAERAGLRARDRILSLDGTPVASGRDLVAAVSRIEPGSWVSFEVERGGQTLQLTARLGERPAGGSKLRQGWIGVSAIDLPGRLREHFGAPQDAGIMIADVEAASPAEVAGLEPGDVVYEIDGRALRSVADLRRRAGLGGVGNKLEIRLVRGGSDITVEAVIGDTPKRGD